VRKLTVNPLSEDLFQEELLMKYEIASSASLSSSIKALKTKGILDEEVAAKGNVLFDDPLLSG